MFVARAMGIVVLSIAVFGPRTNHRSLEEISRGVPRGSHAEANWPV